MHQICRRSALKLACKKFLTAEISRAIESLMLTKENAKAVQVVERAQIKACSVRISFMNSLVALLCCRDLINCRRN